MMTTVTVDPVLVRFRQALDEVYGPQRIERVVLFGSRARGDAGPESDYDLAVFLHGMDRAGRFAEMNRLADLSTDILDETGQFVHAMPYRAGSYNEPTALMLGIRTDGIEL
jgi:predicted nucleotidyltransferase